MSEIKQIIVPYDTWVNVNEKTSIAQGTALSIQNTSTVWVQITESTTTPNENTHFKLITNLSNSSSEAMVLSGSLPVWVKSSVSDRNAIIVAQEV